MESIDTCLQNDKESNPGVHFEYDDFLVYYKPKLTDLLAKLRKMRVDRVCLEGGHIYNDEKVFAGHLYALKSTGFLKRFLAENGFEVNTLLYVDDYNTDPADCILDVGHYMETASKPGLDFDVFVAESGVADLAGIILEVLEGIGHVTEENGFKCLSGNRTHLTKEGGKFSRPLLDAALTMFKLITFGNCPVNVLPVSYKDQQRNTRKILGEFWGHRLIAPVNFLLDIDKETSGPSK